MGLWNYFPNKCSFTSTRDAEWKALDIDGRELMSEKECRDLCTDGEIRRDCRAVTNTNSLPSCNKHQNDSSLHQHTVTLEKQTEIRTLVFFMIQCLDMMNLPSKEHDDKF